MDEHSQKGVYNCQGCGAVFKAPVHMDLKCPKCGTPQVSVKIWDQVCSRRDHQLGFEQSEQVVKDDDFDSVQKLEKAASLQADIVGRQRAKQRAVGFLMGACWIAGIVGIFFVSGKRNKEKSPDSTMVLDGSMSVAEYEESIAISRECMGIMNRFLQAPNIGTRTRLVANPDEQQMITYYSDSSAGRFAHVPKVTGIDKFHRLSDDIMTIHFSTLTDNNQNFLTEAVFVKKQEKWLLDWKAYTNYNRTTFDEYLNEEPIGIYQFRVLAKKSVISHEEVTLSFLAAEPNNIFFSRTVGNSENITLHKVRDNDLWYRVKQAFDKAEAYKDFNLSLNDKNQSILASLDPIETHRLRATFEFVRIGTQKQLKLRDISAIHWLGDYYSEFSTPSQSLTEGY